MATPPTILPFAPSPASNSWREDIAAMIDALSKLPEDQQEVAKQRIMDNLSDPEFVKKNPGYVKMWGSALGVPEDKQTPMALASSLANIGTGFSKLAFSMQQQKRADKIGTTPPAMLRPMERNRAFQVALGDAYSRQGQGMTPEEMAAARFRMNAARNAAFANAQRSTGGQAGAGMAGAIATGMASQVAEADLAARDAALRQRNIAAYNNMLGASLAEDRAIRADQNSQFYNYTMPLWRQRVAERAALERAAETNKYRAQDAIAANTARVAGLLGDELAAKVAAADAKTAKATSPIVGVPPLLAATQRASAQPPALNLYEKYMSGAMGLPPELRPQQSALPPGDDLLWGGGMTRLSGSSYPTALPRRAENPYIFPPNKFKPY